MIGRIIKTVANEVMRRRTTTHTGASTHPVPPDPLGGARRSGGGEDMIRKVLGRFMKR